MAILICDAPSHGVNSNGGCGDYHPNDDIRDAILMLIKKNITLMGVNFTAHTETMYSYIEKVDKIFIFLDICRTLKTRLISFNKYGRPTIRKYLEIINWNDTKSIQIVNLDR